MKRSQSLEALETFYQLHVHIRKNKGVPVQPWSFFRLLYDDLIAKDLGHVFSAEYQGETIASAVLLHWKDTLTCKYAASDIEKRNVCPNNLIFWHSFQWGVEKGYKTFDFGRTDIANEGLRLYKRRWGAEETPLTYTYTTLSQGNFKKYLMPVLGAIIRKGPHWICKAAGNALYKYSA